MSADLREPLGMWVEHAKQGLVYGLEQTPDDRLNWSPGGEAATPLQLADKVAGFMGFVAANFTGEEFDPSQAPPPSQSREEAQQRLNQSCDRVAEAIAGLSDEDLARPIVAPWGRTYPLAFMATGVAMILGYFQGQLNYAQMAYGDGEPNIPPQWMAD